MSQRTAQTIAVILGVAVVLVGVIAWRLSWAHRQAEQSVVSDADLYNVEHQQRSGLIVSYTYPRLDYEDAQGGLVTVLLSEATRLQTLDEHAVFQHAEDDALTAGKYIIIDGDGDPIESLLILPATVTQGDLR